MRLLVCGGRHFDDAVLVEAELTAFHAATPISVVIHGGLPCIGMPVESWARRNKVHVVRYPANFSLGKSGDSLRDAFMLGDSRADMLLIFPGGRRTAELLREAERKQVPVIPARGVKALLWAESAPDRSGGDMLPVDREGQLLAV